MAEIAEVERMQVHGALPVDVAIEKMIEMGLVVATPHPPMSHGHKPSRELPVTTRSSPVSGIRRRRHDDRRTHLSWLRACSQELSRRHRLAERLFTDSLAMDSESEIEEQACKFEHILSPEATDKICAFLGHPRTCPHGAPIPPGPLLPTDVVQEFCARLIYYPDPLVVWQKRGANFNNSQE